MRNVYAIAFLAAIAALICACRETPVVSPLQVKLIQPAGGHCHYAIAPTTLRTLSDLSKLRGRIGSVVTSAREIDFSPDVLNRGLGFAPIDGQFLKSGDVYVPRNYATLFAASVYGAAEAGYLLHARLNPAADFTVTVPRFAERTFLIVNARRRVPKEGGRWVPETDNAEYLPHKIPGKKGEPEARNYILTFPLKQVKEMPLGLNLGVMVHEYTHLVFQHLFFEPASARGTGTAGDKPTRAVLASINEGIADYFGFLATKDPAFFLCSFPGQNRDLSVPKRFTPDLAIRMASDAVFDPHEGGAVFASINYEIGREIGFEKNGELLERLMASLLDRPAAQAAGLTNTLDLDFSAVARCHAALDRDRAPAIAAVYEKFHVRMPQGEGS